MPEHDIAATTGGRRRTAALGIALFALAAAAAVAIYAGVTTPAAPGAGGPAVGGTSAASPPPASAVSPTPSPPTAAPADDAAVEVIADALAVPITTATTAEELDGLLADTVTDSYAAEVTAQWQELVAQGWTISGTPRVVSAAVTPGSEAPSSGRTEITACIDSSDVVVRDLNGAPVGDSTAMMPRALHLFTVVLGADGTWRVAGHSFPDDPAC